MKKAKMDPAQKAATELYAKAHDRFAEQEQRYVGQGQHVLAAGAHEHGLYALRAWLAEQDDPDPMVSA